MSCEDCGDESFIEDDSSVQMDIFDDDSQIIFDVSALEVDICDEDIQLVEVDGGIVYFEEDAQIEVLDFDDVIEIIECVETTGSSGSGAVDSVNGETGVVVLNATDVGADPAGSAATAQANANAYTDTEIGNIDFPVDSVNGQTNVVVLDWTDVGADQAGSAGQALIDANNYTDTEIGALNFLTEAQADLLYRSDYVEVVTTHKTITQPGTYLIFNTLAPTHLDITLPDPEDFPGAEIFLLNAPFGFIDIDGTVDGQTTTIYPPNSFIGLRSFQLPVLFGGTWLWGSAQRAGIPFDLPAWWDSVNGVAAIPEGHILKIVNDIISGVDIPTWVAPPAEIPDGTMVNDVPTWDGTEYVPMPIVEKTTTLFDETTTPGVIYIGKAQPTGSAISEAGAVWSIKTIDATADVEIKWADGVTTYTKVWDNRASYSYY